MSNELNEQVAAAAGWIKTLRAEIGRVIVGQEQLVDRLLVGLLANGHVLLEGVPGLAKTLCVRTLASAIDWNALTSASASLSVRPDISVASPPAARPWRPRTVSTASMSG